MALEREDMERRRQKREAARRRARKRKQRMLLMISAALVVLVGCGIVISRLATGSKTAPVSALNTPSEPTAATGQTTEATEAGRRTKDPITTIHIRAVGDLNVTNSVVDSGIAASGYDYTRAFMDVAAELADADVTVMNLEGNFCGEPYGSETASAPTELLT